MEYLLINEEKLKVMLEQEDLARWDISIEALDYSNPDAQAVFESILQYAREAFGFDTAGHKVLLQIYPSRDGGGELFITRLPSRCENSDSCAQERSVERVAYRFDKLGHLISVCRKLIDTKFDGDSEAWADENGGWYLVLSRSDLLDFAELPVPHALAFIEEYGELQSARSLSLYLGEHADIICERDAIATLGKI